MSVVQGSSSIILRSPGALATAIPSLVGFQPEKSLVVVFLGEGRVIVTVMIDTPEHLATVAEYVAATGTRVTCPRVDSTRRWRT